MKVKLLFILTLALIAISCKTIRTYKYLDSTIINTKQDKRINDLINWHFKDIELDTIPGISLNRAYDSLLSNKKGTEIIVAIIDTEIDSNHKDLKNHFWVNEDEIPNNGKDDDNNGYIDDVHGWNFIGNLDGYNIIYSNYECVRIIQKFRKDFEGKQVEDIDASKKADYDLFIKAKNDHAAKIKLDKSNEEYVEFLKTGYPAALNALKELYPQENYTVQDLDSIYNLYKDSNKTLAKHAYFLADWSKYDLSMDWVDNYQKGSDSVKLKTNNINYYDRLKIDPYPDDITYTNYGSPFINRNIDEFDHGTKIAGLVLQTSNKKNLRLENKLKIMPVAISSNGDEYDKDIALAIRFAVDNGAKVINISFGKGFSLNKDWVFEAINYAELNDVLVISSSGNAYLNLNDPDNNTFPNDHINNQPELTDNFLLVGATTYKLDKNLFSYFSNYGNNEVDLFAPGEEVYTTLPNDKYGFDSGTSLSAAITSGVAALIRSYYPELTASQVKHILMDSGIEYTIPVATPTKEDPDKTTPFNELSKSGKVLNAYNALLMAERIARGK